jgi:anthranilate phosphoribosyltransferase
MGTSLVLEVAGLAQDATAGVALAADTIDGGMASAFLENYRQHFAGSSS